MTRHDKLAQRGQLVSVISISLIAIILIIGISLKKRPKVVSVQAAAEQVIPADTIGEIGEIAETPAETYHPRIDNVFFTDGRMDIQSGERLYTILKDSAGWEEPAVSDYDNFAKQLNCLVYEGDQVIIGGQKLTFTGHDYVEVFNDIDLGAPVNVVLRFGEGYLVGANNGLHYVDDAYTDTLLKADWLVSELAEDASGLWIGTFGDGLWRFDGEKWQRRYLLRDTTIFDFVTALQYCYPYVWVGTPSGIFRYDGASWQQLFADNDSSAVCEVNCILPRLLHTYIGTQQGLFVFANDTLEYIPEFENEQIVGLFKDGQDILVATRENGIFTFKGKEEILRPEQLPTNEPYLADTE